MRAIVMSGGGAFGAYEAGALDYLTRDLGRDYEILCGVSAGALNASYLGQAPPGEMATWVRKLCRLWETTTTDMVYKKRLFGELAALFWPSVYDSTPYIKLVQDNLDVAKVQASGRKVRIGAVCWDSGEYRVIREQDSRLDWWTIASASYPVFFLPIKIDGAYWGDGGLRNVTPIKEALKLGCKEIDVVVAQNVRSLPMWSPRGEKAVPGYLFRALDIIMKELSLTDLQVAGVDNPYAQLAGQYEDVQITVCQPLSPLIGSSLTFDPAAASDNIKRGREDARRVWREA
jgi:NTE family protein